MHHHLPTPMHANTTGRPVHLCLSAFIGGYFYTSPLTKKNMGISGDRMSHKMLHNTPPHNHTISPSTPPRAA